MGIVTRQLRDSDQAFLLEVFEASRGPEFAALGLPFEQLALLLRLQFAAQQRCYSARFPDAEQRIVVVDGNRAGQLRVARRADMMILVDVALLPAFQGRGHGTQLLRALIDEAARRSVPLRLSVRANSRARALYQRLGFREHATSETDVGMVLLPPGAKGSRRAGACSSKEPARAEGGEP
jgi:GNAT superfamily N-acetyltransferase